MTPQGAPRRARARAGFTIVEMLVAVMVFSVGLLAVAGASSSITGMMGSSKRRVQAASIAASRFEMLRSISCVKLFAGSSTSEGITSSWTVKRVPNTNPKTGEVTLTVTVPERGSPKVYTFHNVFPC
jgi:prepilin-type N-terminal cleavage/methylation domain-containing protein